jgi:hypothetical protein
MQRCTTTRESKSRESQELGQCSFSNQFAWPWMFLFVRGRLGVTSLGVSSVAFWCPVWVCQSFLAAVGLKLSRVKLC